MKYLLTGSLLVTVGASLLNSIADTISIFFELLKSLISIQIAKSNVKITELTESEEPVHTRAIGFSIDSSEEDDDYD